MMGSSVESKIKITVSANPFKKSSKIYEDDILTYWDYFNKYVPKKYSKEYICFYDGGVKVEDWESKPITETVTLNVLPAGDGTPEGLEEAGTTTGKVGMWVGALGFAVTLIPGGQIVGAVIMGLGAVAAVVGTAINFIGQTMGTLRDNYDSANSASVRGKQAPSVRGGSNPKSPNGPVPLLLGRHLVLPFHASVPYTSITSNNQYLHQLFVAGYNNLDIETDSYKIGETLYSSYTDVTAPEVEQSGDLPDVFPKRVVPNNLRLRLIKEDAGVAQDYIRTTATNTKLFRVNFSFPRGLYRVNDSGDTRSETVRIIVSYREAGNESASWIQVVDDYITEKVTETHRFSYEVDLDNITTGGTDYNTNRQYDIKVQRKTDDNRERVTDTLYWDNIQSETGYFDGITVDTDPIDASIRSDLTLIGLKVKASDQFNGIIEDFSFIATSKVRDFNGTTWVEDTPSSNPASLFLYMLTGANATKHPIDDSLIDFDALEEWHTYCETNGLEYNAYVNSTKSKKDVLNNIAIAGNASWFILDGLYTVVIDDVKPDIVQCFTPRNSWEFSGSKVFSEYPTAIDVTFINSDNGFVEEVFPVYYDNVEDRTNVQETAINGVTNSEQAAFLAQRILRKTRYRPETFSFNADIESIVCTIGDRIKLQHDVPLYGLVSGRIKSKIISGTDLLGVISDELVIFEVGKTYQIRVRKNDLSTELYTLDNPAITESVQTDNLSFTTPVDNTTANINQQDLFMFGESGLESVDLIVLNIEPSGEFDARLICTDYSPEIFASYTPPPYDAKISTQDTIIGDFEVQDYYEQDVIEALSITNNLYISNQSIDLQRPASYDVTVSKGLYHRFSTGVNSYFISVDSGYYVYKKDNFDRLSNGVLFYEKPTTDLAVLDEDEIIISSVEDNNNLYHFDGTTETQLTSVLSNRPYVLSDTELLYVNYNDNMTLYKKSIDILDNGTQVLDLPIESYCVVSDHEIIYASPSNDSKLYYKDLDVVGDGTAITTSGGTDPCYDVSTGDVYFVNINNYVIYRTTTEDASDGDLVFPYAFALTINIDGDLGYTDIINNRLKIALSKGKKKKLNMVIPAPPADISFTADLAVGSVNLSGIDEELINIAGVGDQVACEFLPLGTTITYIGVNYIEVSNAATQTATAKLCFLNASADYIGESSLLPGSITETKISDSAISTPKLQANVVTADKIDVASLFAENISVTGTIKSDNYSSGVSGWLINGSGSAEFNDIDIRNSALSNVSFAGEGALGGAVGFSDEVSISWSAGETMDVDKMDALLRGINTSNISMYHRVGFWAEGTYNGVSIAYINGTKSVFPDSSIAIGFDFWGPTINEYIGFETSDNSSFNASLNVVKVGTSLSSKEVRANLGQIGELSGTTLNYNYTELDALGFDHKFNPITNFSSGTTTFIYNSALYSELIDRFSGNALLTINMQNQINQYVHIRMVGVFQGEVILFCRVKNYWDGAETKYEFEIFTRIGTTINSYKVRDGGTSYVSYCIVG